MLPADDVPVIETQDRPHVRRRFLRLFVGLAVLALAAATAAVAIEADALLEWYHLRNLRRSPNELYAYVTAESPRRVAAGRAFLEDPAGQDELFRLYFAEIERTKYKSNALGPLRRARKTRLADGFIGLRRGGYILRQRYAGKKGFNEGSLAVGPDDPKRRELILSLLDACAGRTYTVGEFPDFEFEIQRVDPEMKQRPTWPGSPHSASISEGLPVHWGSSVHWRGKAPVGLEHICFFRYLPTRNEDR